MNKYTLLGLAVSTLLLTGCGGGGNSSDEDTGTGDTGTGDTGAGDTGTTSTPIAQLTCSDASLFGGRTTTLQSGNQGDIEYNCRFPNLDEPTGLQFNLASGIPSLNIVDIQKTAYIDISCTNDGSGTGTTTYNYTTGRVVRSGTFNGQSLSCTSTFSSPLEKTVTDNDSMADLFQEWGTDTERQNAGETGLLNTTCPQGDDDISDINLVTQACTGFFLENYTIKDDSGKTHTLSTKTTLN